MFARTLVLVTLVGAAAAAPAAAQSVPAAGDTAAAKASPAPEAPVSLDHARKLVDFFWAGQADSLWAQMSPTLREKVGSPGAITEKLLEVASRHGSEVEVLEETIVPRDGRFVYERTIQLENAPAPLLFLWTYDADGKLSDVNMRPKNAK